MILKKIFLLLLIVFFLFSMVSCATTTLTSVWKDENYKAGQIKKILVFGVSDKPAIKRFFEDEFVKKLKTMKIEAVPSYAVIPSEKMQDKEYAQKKVKEMQFDGILITRLVDKRTIETYYPPEKIGTFVPPSHPPRLYPHFYPPAYYHGWYGYYYDCYQCITTPGYRVEDEILSMETNLYDVKTDKLIWSALSDTLIETFDGGINKSIIQSFIDVIIKKLSKDNVI
ncbi:MAG: hypothetical protein IBX72_05165 [Nitrospirae bacterium]|jgi:hypothetical protein|nr:hypothetical protein [Nitrospirota bacterium]